MAAWVTIDEAVNLTRNPVCDVDFHFRPVWPDDKTINLILANYESE